MLCYPGTGVDQQTRIEGLVATRKKLGNAAFKARDFSKAIGLYEKAVNIDPNNMSCWDNLATILLEANTFQEVRG